MKKRIGEMGEQIVLEIEKRRLEHEGYNGECGEVRYASYEEDGYDILSYEKVNGVWLKKYIEVKSTASCHWNEPFNISHNEVEASEQKGERYFLYRLYNLSLDYSDSQEVAYFIVNGPIRNYFALEEVSYEAIITEQK